MSVLLRNVVIFGLLIYSLQSLAMGADFDTQAGLETFIENFVSEQLPGPMGDVVSIVEESPAITKAGLILWLNKKMTDAATDGDWAKHERYLAFYTCIAKHECDDLQALAEKSGRKIGVTPIGNQIEKGNGTRSQIGSQIGATNSQDSSQTPPYGYDQGVWVLTNRTSTIEQRESTPGQYGYHYTLSIRGNSVTGSTSWSDGPTGCSGHFSQTLTWTTLPSVLTPGTKQEITTSAKVDGGQSCSARHAGFGMNVYVPQMLRPTANVSWYSADPIPPIATETATWEMGWGRKIGDTMAIEICPNIGARASGCIIYTYTYQASAPESLPKPSGNTVDDTEKVSLPKSSGEAGDLKGSGDVLTGSQPEMIKKNFAFNKPGSTWKVKEYGPMGNWDGDWIVRDDGKTIDASWSSGRIKDIIEIRSVDGNQISLYRHGNQGYYTGTISPDGTSISGTGSWYSPGETWTASTSSGTTKSNPEESYDDDSYLVNDLAPVGSYRNPVR